MKSWFHGRRRCQAPPETSHRCSSLHVETVPYTNRAHVVVSPRRNISKLSTCDFAGYKWRHAADTLAAGHPYTVRVRRITAELVRAVPRGLAICGKRRQRSLDWFGQLDWEVIVVTDDSFTAMTWPSVGKIVVSAKILRLFDTDVEIAMILAHEVGHVIARHDAELRVIVAVHLNLPFLRRRSELEADRIGILVLAAAGYDPRLGLEVLNTFVDTEKEELTLLDEFVLSYLMEHPLAKKRLQLLSRPKVIDEAVELYRKVGAGQGITSVTKYKGSCFFSCISRSGEIH